MTTNRGWRAPTHETSPDGMGESDDWVMIPPSEAPASAVDPPANVYLDFQMRTIFGKLSIKMQQHSAVPEVNAPPVDNERVIDAQEQSPLFKLPTEIRLYIFERVLRVPTTGSSLPLTKRSTHERQPSVLTVLLTCRRALAEAEAIFYSINRLSVENPQFWTTIGLRRRDAITRFTLPARSAGSTLFGLQQLRNLPNLKSLHIQRTINVKYQDVKSWAIMASQLTSEIRQMKALVDIKISTPDATGLTEHEMASKRKLEEMDRKICVAVTGSG